MKKVLALILTLSIALSIVGCGAQAPAEETTLPAEDVQYTLHVQTLGGMAMADVEAYVYEGSSLIGFGQTNDAGDLALTMPASDSYTITLEGVPDGYALEEAYTFTDRHAAITLTSNLRTDVKISEVSLRLGDVMPDFTVTTADGQDVTLSALLGEKDMVLLNFWYSTCGPCANEFPFMQAAFESYSDKAAVVAVDPLEDATTVATYQASMGLGFHMAACPASWSASFGISGYPTSVVIDRYGVICLVEVGAVTSQRAFDKVFEYFTAADYTQQLFASLGELVTTEKPDVTMPASEEIAAVLSPDLDVTYRPETEEGSAEYSWPFVITEKNGEKCLKASNQQIEGSYAILYADVYLEEGQSVAFDYLSSTERGCDVLYVIVDGEDVHMISGWDEEETWKTCYAWVATQAAEYEVALCYLKDGDTDEADDTVYIKNLRIVDEATIDEPTYISTLAAKETDAGYIYEDIVFNEEDGYYHVRSADGPLLLADLMGYTQFQEETTLWELVYEGTVSRNGENVYEEYVDFFSYASNSQLYGLCPVNKVLEELLILADACCGFDEEDDTEWLQACKYYAAYGTEDQLSDPIAGLSTFSAYEAKLGKDVETNYFYYDRPIMPRGLLAKFTPEQSGVYRIVSKTDSLHGVEAWIFQGNQRESDCYTYEADQRMQLDATNCYMYYYMEAGQDYYIDIAFWDIYEVGTIYYDIEYVAATYDVFRLASPGFFTYDADATGAHMYDIIAGGIDVVLGDDGIYYHDLGDGKLGSKLYADFTGITGIFSQPLTTVETTDENGNPVTIKGIIQRGGFDFSKTENDMFILDVLAQQGSQEAAIEYLQGYWGEDYEFYYEEYLVDEVFAGKYHGHGEDYTDEISAYLDDIITYGSEELVGCVVVTEELAELLQLLMDKYTFGGVDHSWTKMCYYYDHLGPQG